MGEIEEVERFVNSFGVYLYVDEVDDSIVVTGTYDDLDPEPERENVRNALRRIKREIEYEDDFPVQVEKVSDIESRYGYMKLRIYKG